MPSSRTSLPKRWSPLAEADLCRPSWSLAGVVGIISCGLLLLVYGESNFNPLGFAVVMTASMLSGLRWTITQVLLQGTPGSSGHGASGGPVEVLLQLTPGDISPMLFHGCKCCVQITMWLRTVTSAYCNRASRHRHISTLQRLQDSTKKNLHVQQNAVLTHLHMGLLVACFISRRCCCQEWS